MTRAMKGGIWNLFVDVPPIVVPIGSGSK